MCSLYLRIMAQQPVAMSQPTKPTVPIYACGYVHGRESYGMWAGPTDDLSDLLDRVPDEKLDAVILRFNVDGTNEIAYKWDGDGWTSVSGTTLHGAHTEKDIARVVILEYRTCIESGAKPTVEDYASAISNWLLRSELPAKLS